MQTIIGIVLAISGIFGIVGYIWGIIVAFQKSPTWGCVSLFFAPIGAIAFLVMTWRENYMLLILILQAVVIGTLTVLVWS